MPRQINFFHLPDETAQFIDVLRRFSFPTTVICWVILVFSGCNTLVNTSGVSYDISESVSRNIFVSEYYAPQNPVIINDSIKLDIKEAWLENQWRYLRGNQETGLGTGFQLVIFTKNDLHKGYSFSWTIGVDGERYFRSCGKNCLLSDFDSLPVGNRETWKIQAGDYLYPEAEKTIIGELVLLKK